MKSKLNPTDLNFPLRDASEVVLPPRKPKGSPANMRRSFVFMVHNHQQKVRQMGDYWKKRHAEDGCHLCTYNVKYRPVV